MSKLTRPNILVGDKDLLYADVRAYIGQATRLECTGGLVAGDGAGGVFVYDPNDRNTADDGATVLVDAWTRRWKRQIGDTIHFAWWTPDLTGNTDCFTKLKRAAHLAADMKKKLQLPAGVIGLKNEFIPPNGLWMEGYGNSLRAGNAYATVLKWIGDVVEKRAVVRCSRSPIGETPSEDVSGVRLRNFMVDCDNRATNGFYFRYFTNESYCDQITAIKARVVGISVYQSWFASFGTMVAHDNYGRGVVIGFPTQGESGDLAVNGITFDRIRTHTNGLNHTFNPEQDSPNRWDGAGLITRCSGCTFNHIQSERNWGFGWIETSPRSSNEYGCYYTEFNGAIDGSNGYGFLSADDVGGLKSVLINNVCLYSREQFINDSEHPVSIGNFTKALDAYNSVFSGNGGFRILGGTSVAANQHQSESNYAQALRSTPHVLLNTSFDVSKNESLSAGVVLPPEMSVENNNMRVKVQIIFHDNFPGGNFNLKFNGEVVAYFKESSHPKGYVLEKDIKTKSGVLLIELANTEIGTSVPATLQLSIGRFNNGDVAKMFKWQ